MQWGSSALDVAMLAGGNSGLGEQMASLLGGANFVHGGQMAWLLAGRNSELGKQLPTLLAEVNLELGGQKAYLVAGEIGQFFLAAACPLVPR